MFERLPPEYWQSCADEARKQALSLGDMASQRIMLDIALTYEQMARRIEEMANHPHIVTIEIPGVRQVFLVIATTSIDAENILKARRGATTDEKVCAKTVLHDDVATAMGADLSRHGAYGTLLLDLRS